MARGNPSRRQQISATADALSLVMAKSGLTAWARARKSRVLVLGAQMKRHPACGQHFQPHCGLKKIPDGRRGLDEMLDVVEDQEQRLCR